MEVVCNLVHDTLNKDNYTYRWRAEERYMVSDTNTWVLGEQIFVSIPVS